MAAVGLNEAGPAVGTEPELVDEEVKEDVLSMESLVVEAELGPLHTALTELMWKPKTIDLAPKRVGAPTVPPSLHPCIPSIRPSPSSSFSSCLSAFP
jgi:hypothetical protein